jgi:ribosomal protein L11 methyltransferase
VLAFEVRVRSDQEDLATAVLWECGTAGIESRAGMDDEVMLLAYFEERVGLEGDIRAGLGAVNGARLQPVPVPDVDWVARFREGFRSFQAGGFEIVPVWEARPARPEVLVVDPGRAFGTGTHQTTRLCLAAISGLSAERPLGRVLDVGTGTGLLALAAARKGAVGVIGVDNDPEAIGSAAEHARLNAVELSLVQGDGARPFAAHSFDLVLANLTTPLLLAQSEALGAVLRPGGILVLSGLLMEDVGQVQAAYRPLGALTTATDGEWASLRVRAARP